MPEPSTGESGNQDPGSANSQLINTVASAYLRPMIGYESPNVPRSPAKYTVVDTRRVASITSIHGLI